MTSPSRTFGLLATLVVVGALVAWLVWRPETDSAAQVEFESNGPAPTRSSADLLKAMGPNAEPTTVATAPSERTSIGVTPTPVDASLSTQGLHGIVIDMTGHPVAGAVVAMLHMSPEAQHQLALAGSTVWNSRGTPFPVSAKVKTNELGLFTFTSTEITADRRVVLAIEKKDYLLVHSFPVEDTTQGVTIQIEIGASISLPVSAWPAIERDEFAAVRIAFQKPPDRYINRVIKTFPLKAFREQAVPLFDDLPADTYVVEVVVGPGRWTAFSQTVTVEDGEHRQLDPVEIGEGFAAYDLKIVDQNQRPVPFEKLRVDSIKTGLTAFGVPLTDADGHTFFVIPNNLGPLRMVSYNNGAANLSPSFGARVSKEGGARVLTFMLTH